MKLTFYIILIKIYINQINAHTWVDELSCSCPDTKGYPRNYLSRDQIADFDIANTHKILIRNDNSKLCSDRQSVNNNDINFPKLKCTPGSIVSFKYNPNGHISKDLCVADDPRGCNGQFGSMSYWYIASNKNIFPQELITRGQVNKNYGLNIDKSYDNKLSNIVSYRNRYDMNGSCKEDSDACVGSFRLPYDLLNHTDYQFVFYHVFDRNPFSADGEEYTTCFTIHSHYYDECVDKKTPNPKCNLRKEKK